MGKPTYYLWKSAFISETEYEEQRNRYTEFGFRVVTFQDGHTNTNIHEGLKSLIKNHLNGNS